MTPEQIQIVRLTLAQATVDHVALGREFYQRLLIIAPDLRARFHGDIAIESAKLKDALKLAFGALSDLPFLVTTLEALAARGIATTCPISTAARSQSRCSGRSNGVSARRSRRRPAMPGSRSLPWSSASCGWP